MSITWTTLTGTKSTAGSIANWVNRSDLPVATLLLEAEAKIYQHLRVREMQARSTLTFAAAAQSASMPSDFLDPIDFTPYGWGEPLPFYHEEKLDEQRDLAGVLVSGIPSRWSLIGDTAYVDVACSEAVSGILLYYALPAALSASTTTNWLTRKYPKLLRYACLAAAFDHMKDEARARDYLQRMYTEISEAKMTDDLARRGQHVPA